MSAPPTRGNQYPCRFLLRLCRFPDLAQPRLPHPLLWRRSRVPLSQSEPHLRSGREASTSTAGILPAVARASHPRRSGETTAGQFARPAALLFSPTTDLNSPFVASYTYTPP